MNEKFLKILICPKCKGEVTFKQNILICSQCSAQYPIIDGIPIMTVGSPDHRKQHEFQEKYFDEHFSKFRDYKLDNWRVSYIKRIFEALEIKSNLENRDDLYLDIGVGGSGYTVIEAAKKGIKSIGTDLSLVGMQQAKKFARQQGVEKLCNFVVCSAEALPFQNKTFSKISSIAVLEHITDDKQAIAEIARVTKPNGEVFISVPNTYQRMFSLLWLPYKIHDKKVGHLRHYSEENLIKVFEEKGFNMVNILYSGHLIKFIQYFLSRIFPPLCQRNSNLWWRLEKIDLKQAKIKTGLQLSALFQRR